MVDRNLDLLLYQYQIYAPAEFKAEDQFEEWKLKKLMSSQARIFQKCLTWATASKSDGVKNLKVLVPTSDKLATWSKMGVLGNVINDMLGRRAGATDLWTEVTEEFRTFNNYSSMSAIAVVIAKLQRTRVYVNRTSHIEPLIKISQLVNPNYNLS
ncbi:hypothetical protein M422DRAFT_775356 [Sphaerobolus stellatus SS14]|nr:hypothetical protein M422DRAFT_775356 [Sphaerobolus stellatus SS14]